MSFITPVVGGTNYMSRPPQRPQTTGRPNNEPRQLEFGEAMSNFKHMFPTLDREVIEAVLRANNGLVDATIDQLLSMGVDMEGGRMPSEQSEHPMLPSYSALHGHEPEPAEPPPAYTPRDDLSPSSRPLPAKPYSAWNPPLLGKLPDDFLRLGPVANSSSSAYGDSIADRELEQFLEDEKLAMVLQNEEFMRELRHNKDFMSSLEKDRQSNTSTAVTARNTAVPTETPNNINNPPVAAAAAIRTQPSHPPAEERPAEPVVGAVGGHPASPSTPDDAVLREKLKHMGKSTRKKFDKLAKMFHRKNVNRADIIAAGSAASTVNLLEGYNNDDDDELINAMGSARLEIMEETEEEKEEERRAQRLKLAATQRPSQGDQKKLPTDEPIVFFAEDNEFEYKEEKY